MRLRHFLLACTAGLARVRLFLLAATAGLAADQLSKLLAFALVSPPAAGARGPAVVPGFLYLTLRRNPGISWGVLRDVPPELLVAGNVLIVALLLYYYVISERREGARWAGLALSQIVAGAVGNIIDRIHAGAVLDFIDVIIPLVRIDYPVFNVADILIVAGVTGYVIASWRSPGAGAGPGASKANG